MCSCFKYKLFVNSGELYKNNDIEEFKIFTSIIWQCFETDEFWWEFEESLSILTYLISTYDLEINNIFKENGFEDEDCKKSNKEIF